MKLRKIPARATNAVVGITTINLPLIRLVLNRYINLFSVLLCLRWGSFCAENKIVTYSFFA
jgi:hypothetical protein